MIKIIKPIKFIIAALVATSFSYITYASTNDKAVIDISTTYAPYVNFTGTAPGSSRFYDNSAVIQFIFPVLTNLGTMGLESNVGGSCNINFTTKNNFELIHTLNNSTFGDYDIQFRGETFNQSNNPEIELPCTSEATDLNFIMNGLSLGGIDYFIDAGTYQDIITAVVTTQ